MSTSKRVCKECEEVFEPYDEYDDICDRCAFNRDETDLQICYTCGEWFLARGMTVTCPECQEKERNEQNGSKD